MGATRKTILVVDDQEVNREMLAAILSEEYGIEMAEDGEEALRKVGALGKQIVTILLDLHMPKMDGYAVLSKLQEKRLANVIPVLVITGEESLEAENRCLTMGASDFIRKPFDSSIVRNRVRNTVELFEYKRKLEEKIEAQTEAIRKQYRVLQLQAAKMKENNERIIEIVGTVVEHRNLGSEKHIKRVKGFTRILASHMMESYPEYGLTEEKVEMIVNASSLHDIGKIAISDQILLKPGHLTKEEFEYMKSHTTRGWDILNSVEEVWGDEYGKVSREICRYHHERYDGRGYPDGLKGDAIPISAQLVSVADVYDALVSERVYKDAYTKEEAFHMIVNGECGMFSPKLMECFRQGRQEIEKLSDELK